MTVVHSLCSPWVKYGLRCHGFIGLRSPTEKLKGIPVTYRLVVVLLVLKVTTAHTINNCKYAAIVFLIPIFKKIVRQFQSWNLSGSLEC